MIKINKKEKQLLRKYLKELEINLYSLSEKEQLTFYNSMVFQSLLKSYRFSKLKQTVKREIINPKFIFFLYLCCVLFLIAYGIYSLIK